jgi:glutaredoxin
MYTVITRNNCKYCDKSKELLKLNSIPYVTYNIEEVSSKWVLSLMKEASLFTVPQVFASDGGLIGGYRELEELLESISNKEY